MIAIFFVKFVYNIYSHPFLHLVHFWSCLLECDLVGHSESENQ